MELDQTMTRDGLSGRDYFVILITGDSGRWLRVGADIEGGHEVGKTRYYYSPRFFFFLSSPIITRRMLTMSEKEIPIA